MIYPEEIRFDCEMQENISLEDLRKIYEDGVIIWLNSSGASPNGKPGVYRCVLEYKGHTKFIEKEVPEATANQSMILGAIEAVKYVNKPMRLYLISPTALGFASGFNRKGPNCLLIERLCECIKEKECFLTEVQFINGGAEIKKFVYSCNAGHSGLEFSQKNKSNTKFV